MIPTDVKRGTKVRLIDHPECVGEFQYYASPSMPAACIIWPWSQPWCPSFTRLDAIELIPPEPFDTTTLLANDVVECVNSYGGAKGVVVVVAAGSAGGHWKGYTITRVDRKDQATGDYVRIWEASQPIAGVKS